MSNEELEHFGIIGMKWGRRKSSKVSDMTSEELQTAITRMSLERQYSALKSEKDQNLINKGAKVVGDLVANSAKQTVQTAISKQMARGLDLGVSVIINKLSKG